MNIRIRNQQKHIPLELRRIRKLAQKILTELGYPEAELSLLFVDDLQIQSLNQRYLRRDKPTNVLAFPMGKGEFSVLHPHLLGDIVISVETSRRQSNRFGLDEMGMILLLMIHGVLHLIGYEHERTQKGAREMTARQKELFQRVTRTTSTGPMKPLQGPTRTMTKTSPPHPENKLRKGAKVTRQKL